MTISYVEPLSRAVERMRRVLFQPFEVVKWLVLGFSAWLAGLAGGPGGGGSSWGIDGDKLDHPRDLVSGVEQAWERIIEHVLLIPLLFLLIAVVLAIVLVLLWVSSRAKFIFLDNVVHDRAQIVEPWKRFRTLGNSLFLWRLGFAVVCGVAALLVLIAVIAPAATLSISDALRGLSFAAMFLAILGIAVLAVLAAFVVLLLENFVIPIMYRFDLRATEAWRAFLPWLRSHGGWFVLYCLLLLLVAIPAVAAFLLLCCCTCCIVALPYVGTVILLPVWVTYRILGPEFLVQFDPRFDLFAAAAQSVVVAEPTVEP